MIDILIISNDSLRLSQVVRLINECGGYRTTRIGGTPSMLAERGDSLDSFDVLIVDALSLEEAELPVISNLCHQHTRLTCILLTSDTSQQTLIEAMRAGFRDILGWPLDQSSLGDALHRAEKKRELHGGHVTRILSFISCKGGAGTTFIACNLAHAISVFQKKRVLLIDLNQLYGDAAFLLTNDTAPSSLPQVCGQIERMDSAFFDASVMHVNDSFDVLAGAGDPVKAAEIQTERLEWILGVAIPRYDFVIFDLGQAINQLSIVALDRSDEIHIVLQPGMPHARAGRRLLEILASLGYLSDRLRLLLNRYTRQAERAKAALEDILDMSPSLVLPEDTEVVSEALNEGVPVFEVNRKSGVSRQLQQFAETVVNGTHTSAHARVHNEPRLPRFFSRGVTPKLKTM
jgi:pilus assembly protein CpaE